MPLRKVLAIVAGLDAGWSANIGAYVAALMALFCHLIGPPRLKFNRKTPGLMLTIALNQW